MTHFATIDRAVCLVGTGMGELVQGLRPFMNEDGKSPCHVIIGGESIPAALDSKFS